MSGANKEQLLKVIEIAKRLLQIAAPATFRLAAPLERWEKMGGSSLLEHPKKALVLCAAAGETELVQLFYCRQWWKDLSEKKAALKSAFRAATKEEKQETAFSIFAHKPWTREERLSFLCAACKSGETEMIRKTLLFGLQPGLLYEEGQILRGFTPEEERHLSAILRAALERGDEPLVNALCRADGPLLAHYRSRPPSSFLEGLPPSRAPIAKDLLDQLFQQEDTAKSTNRFACALPPELRSLCWEYVGNTWSDLYNVLSLDPTSRWAAQSILRRPLFQEILASLGIDISRNGAADLWCRAFEVARCIAEAVDCDVHSQIPWDSLENRIVEELEDLPALLVQLGSRGSVDALGFVLSREEWQENKRAATLEALCKAISWENEQSATFLMRQEDWRRGERLQMVRIASNAENLALLQWVIGDGRWGSKDGILDLKEREMYRDTLRYLENLQNSSREELLAALKTLNID